MSPAGPAGDDWRPTATLAALRRRAELAAATRAFFAARGVLEVETPLLGAAAATDLHLASLPVAVAAPGVPPRMWLQTSPELHMKRLLAAGSGPIFQLCRAFRDGEAGALHNPEFTMLEWYRPGFDHHDLMDEMDEMLAALLGLPPARRVTYRDLYLAELGLDPLQAADEEVAEAARGAGLAVEGEAPDRDTWLQLLLASALEPALGRGRPTFVHDFPASQASLARLRPGEPPVAERFEVYVEGVELANGYHELAEPGEQARRFAADREARARRGLPDVPGDARLLDALAAGLPDCAGVALGFDRLVMLAVGAASLREVVAFPADRA